MGFSEEGWKVSKIRLVLVRGVLLDEIEMTRQEEGDNASYLRKRFDEVLAASHGIPGLLGVGCGNPNLLSRSQTKSRSA